jgi:DNA-binding MarR family transcriptional regulator
MSRNKRSATGEELHGLFHEVFVLHGALSDVMDEVHERVGLRSSQCKVADTLDRHGPATVPEVAAWHRVSRQFVQTVCNELVAQGLVEFNDSPRHKRSKLASLTEKGRRVLAQAGKVEAAIIERAVPGMNRDEVAGATALLRAITERVKAKKSR